MVKTYTERKEYVAIQWTGSNAQEIIDTFPGSLFLFDKKTERVSIVVYHDNDYGYHVRKVCNKGDYVIRLTDCGGVLSVCTEEDFRHTYQEKRDD